MAPQSTSVGSPTLREADNAFTSAFELVVTPLFFGVLGYFADRWLGTTPILAVVAVVVVASYEFWKLWANYSRKMDRLQAELLEARARKATPDTSPTTRSSDG